MALAPFVVSSTPTNAHPDNVVPVQYDADTGNLVIQGRQFNLPGEGTGVIDTILNPASTPATISALNFSLSANTPSTIGSFTGSGYISKIWVGSAANLFIARSHVQIYIDGEATPSIDLDLSALPPCTFIERDAVSGRPPMGRVIFSTQYCDFAIEGISGTQSSIVLRWPIPFSQSAIVKFVCPVNTTSGMYTVIEAQLGISSARRARTFGMPNDDYATWSSGTTYAAGAYVLRSGNYYLSISGSNLNNDPATSPNYWKWLSIQNPGKTITGTSINTSGLVLAQVYQPCWLAALGMNLDSSTNQLTILENTPCLYDIASGTPALQTAPFSYTGFEDFFHSAFYFNAGAPNYGGDFSINGSINPGTSPLNFQNTTTGPLLFYVSGGTVSAIQVSPDGSTYDTTGLTSGQFFVPQGQYIKITFSGTPTVIARPAQISGNPVSRPEIMVVFSEPDPSNSNGPQQVGMLRDFLSTGAIRHNNGMLLRVETPVGKSATGNATQFAWCGLYYI